MKSCVVNRCTNKPFSLHVIIIVFITLTMTACGAPTSDGPVNKLAEDIMRAYHESDIDKIMTFYKEPFYKTRSPDQWRRELDTLFNTLGKSTNVTIRTKTADTRFSGKFYIYQFDSIHNDESGKQRRAKHTLTIIRPVDDPGNFFIVGHQIKTK